jgi:hypothetical protein
MHTYIHTHTRARARCKMANKVSQNIKNTLNMIVNTTDQSENVRKELKKTIFERLSTLRNLYHKIRGMLDEKTRQNKQMGKEINTVKIELDACRGATAMRHAETSDTHKHTHTHTHTYMHTYIHAYMHTYTHAYIHMYIHTYIRTYIQTYIHTYVCIQSKLLLLYVQILLYIRIYRFSAQLHMIQSPNHTCILLLIHCLHKVMVLTVAGDAVVQSSFTVTALSLGGLQSPGYKGRSIGMPDSNNRPFLQMDILE